MKFNARRQSSVCCSALLASALILTGCASLPESETEAKPSTAVSPSTTPTPTPEITPPAPNTESTPEPTPSDDAQRLDGDSLYNIFLAEIAQSRRDYQASAFLNFRAARAQQSLTLAERALGQALQSGDQSIALQSALLVQSLDPEAPFGYRAAGLIQLEQGQFDAGYANIKTWLSLDSAANTAAIARASESLNREQRDQLAELVRPIAGRSTPAAASALLALGIFNELNGADPSVIGNFAMRSIERSPSAEAWALRIRHASGTTLQTSIDEALTDFPQDRALHISAIQRLIQQRQTNAALQVGADWLDYSREDYQLRAYLAGLALEQEQWALVENFSTPLLSTDRFRDLAWMHISAARFYSGDLIGAKNAALKVSASSNVYPTAWQIAIEVEEQLAGVDSALEMLRSERLRRPDRGADLVLIKTELLQRAGREQDVADTFAQAISEYPEKEALRLQYGFWLVSNKQYDVAVSILQPLINRNPVDPRAANALAYTYVLMDTNLAEAERLLTYALSQEPDNPAYLDSMGWLRFKQGDLSQALVLLNKALAGNNNPEITAHKVEVLMAQGKEDEAKRVWQLAWDLYPDDQYLQEVADRYNWR